MYASLYNVQFNKGESYLIGNNDLMALHNLDNFLNALIVNY